MTRVFFLVTNGIAIATLSFVVVPESPLPKSSQSSRASELNKKESTAKPSATLRVGHPTFASPHSTPIALLGNDLFVANTPADTVDVIDISNSRVRERIRVGVDPVSVVARPDGKEVWVSNHVSDSVNVIDTDRQSPTYLQIVATIQDLDPESRATRFDEPVGIAFAGNDKAYVALSSENQVAVIDVASRQIRKRLRIPAQDPRAVFVRDNRLYVIPFESNNKTQLSGGNRKDIDGKLVTFDAWEHSIRVNNVLSLGHVTDIVKHPDVPDRDLFVFDTETDKLLESVDTLGTLLYGLTVDSRGTVYIAQADARNDINGRAGTKKHGLKELENRAFLNQLTQVTFQNKKGQRPRFFNLEPLPPKDPDPEKALATPYAIQISQDDSTLVATAAGSNRLFTVDPESGKVLGQVDVGSVPRGIALQHNAKGKPTKAWVYNAVSNSVSEIDLSSRSNPRVTGVIELFDPTHPEVKAGRMHFNDASASTSGTFSCASCHPDGHTDQLLWVLKTPVVSGGNQIMPRSTMPIRGLRQTAPYHWDGIPGDPYGGNNSANIHGSSPPNSKVGNPESTTRHLIDGGLATTMHRVGDKGVNDEGKPGKLSGKQRDEMARFLLAVPYPPAQRRAFDDVVTDRAREGFKLFHIDGDNDPGRQRPNVCGNCHRMPFLVSTNTPGTGMDAPTWRGAYDRFLILPQGRLNIIEFPFYRSVAERGQPEEEIWRFSWGGRRRFNPVWDMVLEGSTGFSGSFGRQVTLNQKTFKNALTVKLLESLEVSASESAIVLEAEGVLLDGKSATPVSFQFAPSLEGGRYVERPESEKQKSRVIFSRNQLVDLAGEGKFNGTFTARHGVNATIETPPPAIWTQGSLHEQRGRQVFPVLHGNQRTMIVSGRHFDSTANVFVNGRRVESSIERIDDGNETIRIRLKKLPQIGLHLLQVQSPHGQFSNDFLFHVVKDKDAANRLREELDAPHTGPRNALVRAVSRGNLKELKRRLKDSQRINSRLGDDGATLLSTAALHGRLDVVTFLLEKGAKVDATNRDGNAPLHVAAFLCRTEIVKLLLDKGASTAQRNNRRETPIDVVSGRWSQGLADFYRGIGRSIGTEIDLKEIKRLRPQIAKILKKSAEKKE